MGYETSFQGEFTITPPLNEQERSFLRDFARTRRMHRLNGPLYCKDTADFGQGKAADILDYNNPPPDQPGLWCEWEVSEDGTTLSGPEDPQKFYHADRWLMYLIDNLLDGTHARAYLDEHDNEDPRLFAFTCDHKLNGTIEAQGEEPDDQWRMTLIDSKLKLETVRKEWVETSYPLT